MAQPSLSGKKLWSVIRASTEPQADKSVPQQREAINQYREQEGFEIVNEVVLPGFSATLGEQVEELRKIIQHKLSGEEFDGIVAQNWGRVARDQNDGNVIY